MKGLFRSKVTLILVYLIMAGVCFYLNWTSGRRDLSNIIVSAVMFAIVLFIFIFAFRRFSRVDSMIRDLRDATDQIRSDFRASGDYLWESYSKRDIIFTNKVLGKKYAEFRDETDRLSSLSGDLYHCDIEDYINHDLIDDAMNRNVMNLVSGTMTGLGILGTFIGLTLGLQFFNTGTSEEIALSIGPLIEGIKIAFHTSIYGMVFSLVFSFLYKNKMDQAYEEMDRFLEAYENFVLPDPANESMRQMLAFEKKQAEGMTEMANTFAAEVSKSLGQIMEPKLNEMNMTLERFAMVATESQVRGIEKVSDKFVDQMNRTLGGTMGSLGAAMKETVQWQNEDRQYMRNILGEIDRMSRNSASVNETAEKSLRIMEEYITKLDRFRQLLAEDMEGVRAVVAASEENAKKQQLLIKGMGDEALKISGQMKAIGDSASQQLEEMKKAEAEFTKAAARHVDSMSESVGLAGQRVIGMAESAANTISGYSDQAAKILAENAEKNLERQLEVTEGAASSMRQAATMMSQAAEQLGEQFSGAYDALADTHRRMQSELESLTMAVESLERAMSSGDAGRR